MTKMRARIDDDGFVQAIVNVYLMGEIQCDPSKLVAPPPSDPPDGKAWRYVNGDWRLVDDLRGQTYANPDDDDVEPVTISALLQRPPTGWKQIDRDGVRQREDRRANNPRNQRARNYPSVESQLDMLWHAMDRGDIPKAPEFFASIKSVKEAWPVDQEVQVVSV